MIFQIQLSWTDDGFLQKSVSSTRMDFGGIAKGYAIDLALEAIQALGAKGGMVDIGGDLRFFGNSSKQEGFWEIKVQHPTRSRALTKLSFAHGASVCTSGNYARYVTIEGKQYSHIIDPRTGLPTEHVPSVTVIADTALKADVWATALSVLGQPGMELLPEGVEALMLIENADTMVEHSTSGFGEYVSEF